MNIRLDIEYDGTEYFGWQKQPRVPTIQGTMESVLAGIVGRNVPIVGAGRTDSGVHAMGQVANFHADSSVPSDRWDIVFNTRLPGSIRVIRSREVADSFHARKDACYKTYEYRILNRRTSSALDRRVYFHQGRLEWNNISESLVYFVGTKDFKAFQGAKSAVKNTVRCVRRFELKEEKGGYFRLIVEGDGFLKQMVRNMVGTVLEVGEGRRKVEDMERVFSSRQRREAGRTAPAQGLFLVQVTYSEHLA